MIKKTVVKKKLASDQYSEDLKFWLSKTPAERIEAVEFLRRQYHGSAERLQRVASVTKRSNLKN